MDREEMRKALNRAFSLGQVYWQQADAESYKQNAKAGETRSKFDALVEETLAAMAHSCEVLRNELHRDIMNIPHGIVAEKDDEWLRGFRMGHRAARHAAAELALSTLSRHGG